MAITPKVFASGNGLQNGFSISGVSVTARDSIVVFLVNGGSTNTVTDNQGNTYQAFFESQSISCYVCLSANVTASYTITLIANTAPGLSDMTAAIQTYSGVRGIGNVSTLGAPATTNPASTPAIAANAGDVVIGCFYLSSAITFYGPIASSVVRGTSLTTIPSVGVSDVAVTANSTSVPVSANVVGGSSPFTSSSLSIQLLLNLNFCSVMGTGATSIQTDSIIVNAGDCLLMDLITGSATQAPTPANITVSGPGTQPWNLVTAAGTTVASGSSPASQIWAALPGVTATGPITITRTSVASSLSILTGIVKVYEGILSIGNRAGVATQPGNTSPAVAPAVVTQGMNAQVVGGFNWGNGSANVSVLVTPLADQNSICGTQWYSAIRTIAIAAPASTVVSLPFTGGNFGYISAAVVLETAPPATFTLTANPSSLVVEQTQSVNSVISIVPNGGFSGPVTLSVSGEPAGVTIVFVPNPATTSSTMQVIASGIAAVGTVTMTVSGDSGNLHASVQVTLEVLPRPHGIAARQSKVPIMWQRRR